MILITDYFIIVKELLGWDISYQAKSLKKLKMTFDEIPDGYFKIHPVDLYQHNSNILLRALDVITKLEIDEGFGRFIVQSSNRQGYYYEVRYRNDIDTKIADAYGKTFNDALYNMILDFIKWRKKCQTL